VSRHGVKVFFPTFLRIFDIRQELDASSVDVHTFSVKETVFIFSPGTKFYGILWDNGFLSLLLGLNLI